MTLEIGSQPIDLAGLGLSQPLSLDFTLNDESASVYSAPFPGETTTPTTLNRFGWKGLEHEPALDLVYVRNRWYSPVLGRFISADPMGYVDGPSMYSFGLNNPVTYGDPMGLESGQGPGFSLFGEWFGFSTPNQPAEPVPNRSGGPEFKWSQFLDPRLWKESGTFLLNHPEVVLGALSGAFLVEEVAAGPAISRRLAQSRFAPIEAFDVVPSVRPSSLPVARLRGSGPAPRVLEVSDRFSSARALANYKPRPRVTKSGIRIEAIEFIWDPKTQRFAVGVGPDVPGLPTLSPHERLAIAAGADESTVLGGMFNRVDGRAVTTELSGHYGHRWTPELRQ